MQKYSDSSTGSTPPAGPSRPQQGQRVAENHKRTPADVDRAFPWVIALIPPVLFVVSSFMSLRHMLAALVCTVALVVADRLWITYRDLVDTRQLEPAYLWVIFVALIAPVATAVYLWKRGRTVGTGTPPFWTYVALSVPILVAIALPITVEFLAYVAYSEI